MSYYNDIDDYDADKEEMFKYGFCSAAEMELHEDEEENLDDFFDRLHANVVC